MLIITSKFYDIALKWSTKTCPWILPQFDTFVTALPISEGSEEEQLKRIAELQDENDEVGQELQKQLEAAEKELNQFRELYIVASDNCLKLKKPE